MQSTTKKIQIKQFKLVMWMQQGCISGIMWGGAGGRVPPPPETCGWEIFADVSGKKRQGKEGKGVKIEKKKEGKL